MAPARLFYYTYTSNTFPQAYFDPDIQAVILFFEHSSSFFLGHCPLLSTGALDPDCLLVNQV